MSPSLFLLIGLLMKYKNQIKRKLTVAPTASVMTVAEAKARLAIETTEDDALIQVMINSAEDFCQQYTGRFFIEQTAEYSLDELQIDLKYLEIPSHQATNILLVQYIDSSNVEITLGANAFFIDYEGMPLRVAPVNTWPTIRKKGFNNMTFTVVEGFGATSASVPDAIINAVALLVGHQYKNRESVVVGTIASTLPMGVTAFLDKYRVVYRNDYGYQVAGVSQ